MLLLISLDNSIEAFSAFKKEWGFFTLDIVLPAAILAIYVWLSWMIYHKRAMDKDSAARWIKLTFAVLLLIMFVPYILPKERLFELLGATGKYAALVGAFLGRVIWELQALGEQQGESGE
jgi:hypothetical protein